MRYQTLCLDKVGFDEAVIDAGLALAHRGYPLGALDPMREPVLLPYTPVARRNAYQQLIYRRAWEHGFAPLPIHEPERLLQLPWPGAMLCHFHWLGQWTANAQTLTEAEEGVARFERLLDALRQQGRRLLWTVHNVLPHDSAWPEQDLSIRRLLVDKCDVIHVMAAQSVDEAAPHFALPTGKLVHAPHPSYLGAYPDFVSRSEARFELGIAEDEFVFLAFGAVQRYKGAAELIEAFRNVLAAGTHRRLRLVIAGRIGEEALRRELILAAGGCAEISLIDEVVGNDYVQYYFRAADVHVCPYRRSLNSGAALLALSYGVPVLAPAMGAFADLIEQDTGLLYGEGGQLRSLSDALAAAVTMDWVPERVLASAQQFAPVRVSDQLFAGLRRALVDKGATAAVAAEQGKPRDGG